MSVRLFASLALIVALLCSLSLAIPIDPRVLEDTENDQIGRFSIHLNTRADLSGVRSLPRQAHTERGWFIYNALKRQAENTQQPLLDLLKKREDVVRIAPVFVANCIFVEGKRAVVELMAKRPEVKAINSNRPFKALLEKTEEVFNVEEFRAAREKEANEWNIIYVNAPDVWSRYGSTGAGIFANADTGVDYTHPDLLPNYRGYNNATGVINHNYHWWDGCKTAAIPGIGSCGVNAQVPCDDNSHGTHTTATAVGQNGLGVAPGAKWIACRNMERGYGTVESYIQCLQFFLAPTTLEGTSPDPSSRPQAIGNSYGCTSGEGCTGGELTEAVEALRASGIFMSVSAGNEGPSCSTIGNAPGTEESVISVGATSLNSDVIASYSSRGPIGTRRGPTVAAPGSSVRSAMPGGGYASKSGTSMASPHVGGYVNLITSICPQFLYDVDGLQALLQSTTRRLYSTQGCGGDNSTSYPNNMYGYGMLDLEAAALKCRGN